VQERLWLEKLGGKNLEDLSADGSIRIIIIIIIIRIIKRDLRAVQ